MTPGNSNGESNGRGPPPWAGPPDHVTDDGEQVRVGPRPEDDARQRASESSDQMERIEAKLDLLLTIMEGR